MNPDALPEEPSELESEPADADEPSDLEFTDMPCTDAGSGDDANESSWEAFVPDDDEWDPQPEPGDFWIDNRLLVFPAPNLGSAALTAGLV